MKKGLFEVADGGTLFLDEIGELSPLLQAKLLRVLEDQMIRRVGGVRDMQVDVRVIAASNRDLEKAVREGQFRQDLYYRLAIIAIFIPRFATEKMTFCRSSNFLLTDITVASRSQLPVLPMKRDACWSITIGREYSRTQEFDRARDDS
jgi:transcriptional regulator of aromatic amino acid metabolism